MQRKNLERLQSEIDSYYRRKSARLRKERENAKKAKEAARKLWEKEDKLIPKKRQLLNEIFAWRDGFVKTKQFKDLFKVLKEKFTDEVFLFGSGYGALSLDNKGNLIEWRGHRWGRESVILSNDAKTAKRFAYQYFKGVNEAIKSGNVYEAMETKLKEKY